MKKMIYSAIAVAAALAGVVSSRSNAGGRRATATFALKPIASYTNAASVANVANWTQMSGFSCSGTNQRACSLVAPYVMSGPIKVIDATQVPSLNTGAYTNPVNNVTSYYVTATPNVTSISNRVQ